MGFWDGAHFSKIFKKTYGISLKNLERVYQFKFLTLNVILDKFDVILEQASPM